MLEEVRFVLVQQVATGRPNARRSGFGSGRNDGPVFLAPHAQRQLAISIPERGKRQVDLEIVGLGPVPVTAASRDMIFDGQLDPAFLRQIQLTIDFGRGKAWARFDEAQSR